MTKRCACGVEQWEYFLGRGKDSKPILFCDVCGDEYDIEELIDLFLKSGKEPKHSDGWKDDDQTT